MLVMFDGGGKVRSAIVPINEVGDIGSAYEQGAQDLPVDFECRDHSDSVVPASSRCSDHIDYFYAYFRMQGCNLEEILLGEIAPRAKR